MVFNFDHSCFPLSSVCMCHSNYGFTNIRGNHLCFCPKYIENSFWPLQSTFRSLEMHAKWPYKICICSCILGELESFGNCKGYSVIIPKILDAIYLRKWTFFWFLSPSHLWIRKDMNNCILSKESLIFHLYLVGRRTESENGW